MHILMMMSQQDPCVPKEWLSAAIILGCFLLVALVVLAILGKEFLDSKRENARLVVSSKAIQAASDANLQTVVVLALRLADQINRHNSDCEWRLVVDTPEIRKPEEPLLITVEKFPTSGDVEKSVDLWNIRVEEGCISVTSRLGAVKTWQANELTSFRFWLARVFSLPILSRI